jgi:hypothetical protein
VVSDGKIPSPMGGADMERVRFGSRECSATTRNSPRHAYREALGTRRLRAGDPRCNEPKTGSTKGRTFSQSIPHGASTATIARQKPASRMGNVPSVPKFPPQVSRCVSAPRSTIRRTRSCRIRGAALAAFSTYPDRCSNRRGVGVVHRCGWFHHHSLSAWRLMSRAWAAVV